VDEEPELKLKILLLLNEKEFWEFVRGIGAGESSSSSSIVSMGPKPFVDGVRLQSTSALVRIHLHPPALHLTQAPPSY
jgi:hypothetical protein